MEQEGNVYLVKTTLSNDNGQEIAIHYLIGESWAELQVISINNKFDYEILKRKINKLARRYPVYAMGIEDNKVSINSPMPIEVLNRDMDVIIRERMVDMIQVMTDIINFHK